MHGVPSGIVKAKLVKRCTDDGLCDVQDHIEIGKIYHVDLRTVRTQRMKNVAKGVWHTKTIIDVVNPTTHVREGWFAYELLQIAES